MYGNISFSYTGAVKVPDLANDVVTEMKPDKMVRLGSQLGLSHDVVSSIKDQSTFDQYMAMFDEWKTTDGTTSYSWKSLIKALRSPSVGEMALATKLQRKYRMV